MIEKLYLKDTKSYDNPMEPDYLNKNDEEILLSNNTKYKQAIGTFFYITTITQTDISAAVNSEVSETKNKEEKIGMH